MIESKNLIRSRIKKLRQNLNNDDKILKSNIIFDKLYNLEVFKNSDIIMCYKSFQNEVETIQIINYCLNRNKTIVLPSLNNSRIVPIKLKDIMNMTIGGYGIHEPLFNVDDIVEPKQIQLIIVPGIAFDIEGNRIGFGKGYYDTFLQSLNGDTCKIGLAYDFQLVENVPFEMHDVKMDIIITEKEVIIIGKKIK